MTCTNPGRRTCAPRRSPSGRLGKVKPQRALNAWGLTEPLQEGRWIPRYTPWGVRLSPREHQGHVVGVG